MTPEQERDKLVARIATNVRKLRLAAELTQEQMRDYDFNYRYYQRLEAGDVEPTLLTLIKLARAFNVELKTLLG